MNSAKPFISVIMPVRNEAEFIERSIRAVINQDYDKECKRVIIHSCLHLLGYNDELPEDKTKMMELEETYLSRTVSANQI